MNIFSFVAEKDRMRARENAKRVFDIYVGPQEYALIAQNGAMVDCEVNGDVLRQNNGKPFGMVFIIRDLTEKKKLQAQLLQSQKMEAIGRLAGGVAHDYNNMTGVILGYATLLEKEIPAADPASRKIKSIISAAERSANLTKQLLAFSRQQIIAPVVLNLNEELDSLKKMLGRLIGEDIKLRVHPQESLWNVKLDPTQFTQIATNLITNARDSIADTGTITIETRNVTVDKSMATSRKEIIPGEYVMLCVRDTGYGMDAVTMGHIFEPFFSTKPQDKGTGLGLATVFGIIKQNNGFINVDSTIDVGTTFTLYFPRHVGESDFEAEEEAMVFLSGTETILVVEDEEELLDISRSALEEQGYTVLSALAPAAALALCEQHPESIDLLVTDVVMPGMNGKELKERLELQIPSLKTLYISGYPADIVAKRGVVEEGMNFLQKPFTPTELLRKVRAVFDGEIGKTFVV
jgi:two-component system, cell cycle sensor histidine kinase and response regulator CckA